MHISLYSYTCIPAIPGSVQFSFQMVANMYSLSGPYDLNKKNYIFQALYN